MERERLLKPPTKGIREMAANILLTSDQVGLRDEVVHGKLLERVRSFQAEGLGVSSSERAELSLEQELGLNLFFNVINFCYKDPETGKEYRYSSHEFGEVKRSSGLKLAMKESGINWNNFHQVSLLNPADFVRIAQLKMSNPLYLGSNRGRRLSGFADFLMTKGFFEVKDFLEDSKYNAGRMLSTLSKSGYFTDVFFKRAQLAVSNLNTSLKKWEAREITEIETLTCMADYRIPQVFYNLGALELNPDLQRKLERQNLIKSGSIEELALRASVIVVGEGLARAMGITEARVDNLLWNLSQKMAKNGELVIPHMLVATDKY